MTDRTANSTRLPLIRKALKAHSKATEYFVYGKPKTIEVGWDAIHALQMAGLDRRADSVYASLKFRGMV